MDPAPDRTDGSRRRSSTLLAPLVLLLSVGAPLGVLAAQPTPTAEVLSAPASPSPSPSATPSMTPGRTVSKSAFSLVPGDCLPVKPPESASVTVVVLPCTQPHQAEVFAVFQLPGSPEDVFPGEPVATAQAVEGCELRFSDYVGIAYGASLFDYFFYKPDAQTWSALNDRTVTCLLTSEPRTLSSKDSRT